MDLVLSQELCKKVSCGRFQPCSGCIYEEAAAKVGTNWVEVGNKIMYAAQNTVLQAVNTISDDFQ